MAQIRLESEKEAKRLEAERLHELSKVKTQKANEIGMYSDYLVKVRNPVKSGVDMRVNPVLSSEDDELS